MSGKAIAIGEVAGKFFHGPADLRVAWHCRRGNEKGYFFVRKRLVDRKAFMYSPRLGWEVDRWFRWDEKST